MCTDALSRPIPHQGMLAGERNVLIRTPSMPPQRALLIVESGEGVAHHELGPGEYTVGASGEVTLAAEGSASDGPRVIVKPEGVFIEDRREASDTMVNGVAVSGMLTLTHDDRVRVGASTLRLASATVVTPRE